MKLNFIVCCDEKNGIAKDGSIPWSFAEDIKWFREKTQGGIVIMGYTTWKSLKHELPGRHTIVMTRSDVRLAKNPPETQLGALVGGTEPIRCTARSCKDALEICKIIKQYRNDPDIWIAGGQTIYEAFGIDHHDLIGDIYITEINGDFGCDRYFPIDEYNKQKIIISSKVATCIDRKTGQSHTLTFTIKRINNDINV